MNLGQVMNIPNGLSLLRMCLSIPLVYAVITHQAQIAFFTLVLAAVSDWADGFIARRFKMLTSVGAWLDPLADKVILNATFLALASVGLLPFWVALILLLRDVVIVAGAACYFKVNRSIDGNANGFGKLSTALQFGVLVWCVFFPEVVVGQFVLALLLFVTLGSGVMYIDFWGRLTLKAYQQQIQSKTMSE